MEIKLTTRPRWFGKFYVEEIVMETKMTIAELEQTITNLKETKQQLERERTSIDNQILELQRKYKPLKEEWDNRTKAFTEYF